MNDKIKAIGKFLTHQILSACGKRTFHFPWAVYVYLTFQCNLRCSYCDDGSGRKFPEIPMDELTPDQWGKLFSVLAKHAHVLLFSGGEPLMYQQLIEVIHQARRAGFSFISINTNSLLLTEEIIHSVDAIIISLDSVDRARSDKLWNRQGATDRVIDLLKYLGTLKHPTTMVNSVITPDNIDDVGEVLRFCHANHLTFSTGPALAGTRPMPELVGNKRYQALIDRIIQAKRDGQRIAATMDYLRAVKSFQPFFCNPLLVWRVRPNGDLVYPCSRINKGSGNLIRTPDPIALFRQTVGGDFFDPACMQNCPLSCYMDTSLMTYRPLGLLREGLYRFRTFARGHRLVY
jgi:MoaA/NifB/PqqE/SkfB family radical SAM enzyme